MPILVTGAHGQLGGELCRRLAPDTIDPDAIGVDVDTLDLTDGDAVRRTLRELQPEAVINCAAYTQVDRAEAEPEAARAVNAAAVEHLADACAELECPLVQISTDHVFDGPPDRTRPFGEDDRPSPRGVYAATKLDGERAAVRCAKHLIVRTCGLYARPSNRPAEEDRARNFVKTMLRLGAERAKLRIVADQFCTPSYVPHVARAVLLLLQAARAGSADWGIYHVTNRGVTTWFDFADEIFRLAGIDVVREPITTAEYDAAAPRPAYSVLDTAKYHALGGPTMPTWQEAIAERLAETSGANR